MPDLTHFRAPERLDTPGFTLRSYQPGDGPLLAEAVRTSHAHLSPWLAWPDPDPDEEAQETLVRAFRAAWLTNRDFVVAIASPEGDRLLGGSGFHLRGAPLGNRVAEIGMWIRADAAGQGLGTAVLHAMLRWGFGDWPFERLEWRCDERNAASRRTAEKAGMAFEGGLRGDKPEVGEGRRTTLVFGLTRSDPLPARA